MQIGIQTISWGARPKSIPTMLAEAKDAGYNGVELMQDPKVLGDPENLLKILRENHLALVGISGGALQERIKYARTIREIAATEKADTAIGWGQQLYTKASSVLLPYVYVDDWIEERHATLLNQTDIILALHPHMFKPVQTAEEAVTVLDAHQQIRFLPDTAHLVVAGDDPVSVIGSNLTRLAAVHLKDWAAEVGRSYQFYARGFVELGCGNVPVKEVVDMLKKRQYVGWLIVEQDTAANPLTSANKSREWLRHRTGV
jgi:inosose dehydratase